MTVTSLIAVHISGLPICHRTLLRFVCNCAEGGRGLPFISQLWFRGDARTEKAQSKNMERLQHRGRGQCLFTGQTPRVRDINITVSSRRRRTTQRVTWGEGKLQRVFGETSKWYSTESAVCSNVYCTNDLPEHCASQHLEQFLHDCSPVIISGWQTTV